MKIRGNTVGTTMKRPDFNQTDERKSDYIKNNPIPVVNEEDEGKIPVVEGGAYVLKEKNSILELVQEIFAFDEEGPSTKKAPSQLATMNALERYMPSGAFNSYVEETIIPMQKRIGTLETTSEAHGEAIVGMGNSIDEIASEVDAIHNTANENEERITDIEDRVSALEGTYELLDNVTTEEELTVYEYIPKNNGKRNMKAFFVRLIIPKGSGTGLVNVNLLRDTWYSTNIASNNMISGTSQRYFNIEGYLTYGRIQGILWGGNNEYSASRYSSTTSPTITASKFDKIMLSAVTSGVPFPIGTNIKIYGVEE